MAKRKRQSTSQLEPFDHAVKTFYRRWFEERGTFTETEREVFFRARRIDLVVQCTEAHLAELHRTVFSHLSLLNTLEFKGVHDPLTVSDYDLIQMRGWGATRFAGSMHLEMDAQEGKLERGTGKEVIETFPSQRSVTIVCVTRPDKLLDTLAAEYRFIATSRAGVYLSDAVLRTWIIHPTELEMIPENYPLLPLALGKKLERFIELCLREGMDEYLQLILDVGMMSDPDVIWRKLWEASQMQLEIKKETLPYIDQFFRRVPEAMRMLPSLQEAFAEATKIAEKRADEGEKRGEQRGKRSTLIRLLQHRFGELPEAIARLIENTEEIATLDRWLDQVLDAKQLTDIQFMPKKKRKSKAAEAGNK